MNHMKARYAHRVGPKPGEVWREVKPTRGRRRRRSVRIISVDKTHAQVRNTRTNFPSWILLTAFTHGVASGWRRDTTYGEKESV